MPTNEEIDILIEQAAFCQERASVEGDWEEACYQSGRIDAWMQIQSLQESSS